MLKTLSVSGLVCLLFLLSCHPEASPPIMGSAYFQYETLANDFRPLLDDFTLNDYVFEDEPKLSDWALDANPNYVDTVKIAALVRSRKVLATTIRSVYGAPVSLYLGYHIVSDGGPNPVSFIVNLTSQPLIWINSNYFYCRNHAEVKIMLKNYPANYNLKWWFLGSDVFNASTKPETIASLFRNDSDGSDYDAGFSAVSSTRSFRAPVGIGYVVVKTPVNTYEVARVNVGTDESVTFTAP